MKACSRSEASPSVDLLLLVLSSVSAELNEDLLGVLEVLPGSLGAHIDAAVGVAGPAVLARVEEVVGVAIVRVLQAIPALAVQEVLRLQS